MTSVSHQHAQKFGELRATLQGRPSPQGWHTICHTLDSFPMEMLEHEVLPYATQLLANWPDDLRSTPQVWLDYFLRGDPTPQLALCTRLWRSRANTMEIKAFLKSTLFQQITHLELVSCYLDHKTAKLLIDTKILHNLHTIDLSFNALGDEGATLIANSPSSSNLKVLRLDQNNIHDDGAQAIARSPHLSNLQTLTLYNNPIGPWGVEELRLSKHLSHSAKDPWLFGHS